MSKRIITISRECGSSGHSIGKEVAQRLNIGFYDKKLIEVASEKSGLDEDFIREYGEYQKPSLLFGLAVDPTFALNTVAGDYVQMSDKIFYLQSEIIREIAESEPCVIVGRCADYILSERNDCLNVFICSDMLSKVEHITSKNGGEQRKVENELKKRDRARAAHYAHYADRKWGAAANYDICLHSGRLGFEKCIEIICNAYKH